MSVGRIRCKSGSLYSSDWPEIWVEGVAGLGLQRVRGVGRLPRPARLRPPRLLLLRLLQLPRRCLYLPRVRADGSVAHPTLISILDSSAPRFTAPPKRTPKSRRPKELKHRETHQSHTIDPGTEFDTVATYAKVTPGNIHSRRNITVNDNRMKGGINEGGRRVIRAARGGQKGDEKEGTGLR